MTSDAPARLLAPYRAVRRVTAGDDAPWSGLLVQLASGESRVLVDVHGIDQDWVGWQAPVDGHVVAPLDLIRRVDGHDVMLPLCVERVADFLVRRTGRRVPLSVGETVTLGVSLVRGLSTWHAIGDQAGEWWLTDGGRPVLACDPAGRPVPQHTADLLRALSDGGPCASALMFAAEAVTAGRVSVHDLRDAEDALFGVAAAEPLATAILGPRSARDASVFERGAPPLSARTVGTPLDAEPERRAWVDVMARHVDADLADAVSHVTTGLWRRLRTPRAGGRRPLILAGGAAAAVLAVGLLWPTGGGGPATADVVTSGPDQPATDSTAGASEAPPPVSAATTSADATSEVVSEDPLPSVDLVEAADSLLAARLACADDEACLSSVIVDPGSILPPGAIDLDSAERQVTLLDDFGGVAVLRVDALDGASEAQLVVIMLHDDRWLLRDVHVAKQP